MDTNSVAEMLQVSPKTVAAWRTRGDGPPFQRVNRGRAVRVCYNEEDVKAWQDDQIFRNIRYREEMQELAEYASSRSTVRYEGFLTHLGRVILAPKFKAEFGFQLREMGFIRVQGRHGGNWVRDLNNGIPSDDAILGF